MTLLRHTRPILIGATLALALPLAGCDAAETIIQGQPEPLREPDLPNCSRIVNCCTNLSESKITGGLVSGFCEDLSPAVEDVIATYSDTRDDIIKGNTNGRAEQESVETWREFGQDTYEPACRCLLEETIAKVSLDGVLTPADCEVINTSGGLESGQVCDDVTSVITGESSSE